MITEENKIEIIAIVKAELSEVGILPMHLIAQKAQQIYDKFQIIYHKLEEKKLLPEGINFEIFHAIYLNKLQQAAAAAHVSGMGIFI